MIGTPFADFIVGTSAAETFYGGGGADLIVGGGGGDVAYGGAEGDSCVRPTSHECESAAAESRPRDPGTIASASMAPQSGSGPALYLTGSDGDDDVVASYAARPGHLHRSAATRPAPSRSPSSGLDPARRPRRRRHPHRRRLPRNDLGGPARRRRRRRDHRRRHRRRPGRRRRERLVSAAGGDDAVPNNGGTDELDAGPARTSSSPTRSATATRSTAAPTATTPTGPTSARPSHRHGGRHTPGWSAAAAADLRQRHADPPRPRSRTSRGPASATSGRRRGLQPAARQARPRHLPRRRRRRLDPRQLRPCRPRPGIDCGAGFDTAQVDQPENGDPAPIACESVDERDPNSFRPPDTPPPPEPPPTAAAGRSRRCPDRRPPRDADHPPARQARVTRSRRRTVVFSFAADEAGRLPLPARPQAVRHLPLAALLQGRRSAATPSASSRSTPPAIATAPPRSSPSACGGAGPQRPLEPKPPSPRADSASASASTGSARAIGAITSWAMRSPGATRKTSAGSVLSSRTLTSPR